MGELQQLIAALQMMQANGGVAVGQKVIGAPTNQGFYSRGMFGYNTETDVLSTMIMDSTLSQWFGFTGSIRELKTTKLLDWVGPTGTDDQSVDWARENDCGDCPSVEWGKCELLACFGEICAQSPTMKLTDMGTEKWEGQPMYYVAGPNFNKVIQTDEEWFLSLAAQVWNQMLQRMLIVGNKTNTPKDFDGLQVLVNTPVTDYRTGARCHSAEPVIYNWASAAISNTICALINSIVRRIRRRALPLGGVRSSAGDLIMVMTSTMRDALLDWVACGCTPCAGGLPWIVANTFDTRSERDRLNGGLYGDGQIPVDGEMVPIVVDDWIPETQLAPRFCSDIFFLPRVLRRVPGLQPDAVEGDAHRDERAGGSDGRGPLPEHLGVPGGVLFRQDSRQAAAGIARPLAPGAHHQRVRAVRVGADQRRPKFAVFLRKRLGWPSARFCGLLS